MVHVVWGTKRHASVLVKDKREILFNHIRENARAKGIYLDTIGGYTDHVHCLISLGADQGIAKVVQLMKGESSFWANQQKLLKRRLTWAEDYFAASVSESAVQKVRNYIHNQEEHHKKVSFASEYKKLMESHGFDLVEAKEDIEQVTSSDAGFSFNWGEATNLQLQRVTPALAQAANNPQL